jgi:tetratricopeptide (TPR) repeat protein
MARAFLSLGEFQGAEKSIEEGLAISLEYGYEFAVLPGLTIKYLLKIAEGRYCDAEEIAHEYQSLYKKTGKKNYLAYALCHKSKIARLRGEWVHALQYAEEALNFIVEDGVTYSNTDCYQNNLVFLEFGYISLQEGNLRKAGTLFRDGVRLLNNINGRLGLLQPLDAVALLAICEDKQERAVRLCGTRWVQGAYYLLSPIERDQRDADLTGIKSALGSERFDQLFAEGQAMSLDEAVALALEE